MSGVSSTIRINDGMSPALRSMNKALMIVLNSFERMQNAVNNPIDTVSIQEARSELANVAVVMDEVEDNIRAATQAQERYTDAANDTQDALSGITGKVRAAVAAYASLQTAKKAVELSDRISNTNARMSMIVDDGGSIQELEQKIFDSANRSRANYLDMADSVAKLSLNAPDAFSNNNETILFAENLNKLFTIAGTEAAAVNSATLQLTQALGSGVLRGEELNSVFEAAPNIIQEIAKYMDVSVGDIRALAAEGQITADIVKNAILGASEEIDQKFNEMPMTFSGVWNQFQNYATAALNPVWTKLSAIANNPSFNNFVKNAAIAVGVLGIILVATFEKMAALGAFVHDNWSLIAPVIGVVSAALALYLAYLAISNGYEAVSKGIKIAMCAASYAHAAAIGAEASADAVATAKQYELNTALYACPLTWILVLIIAIVAAIYLVVAAINKVTGSSISATGVIAGAIATAGAFVWNNLLSLLDLVLGIVSTIWNVIATFSNYFANIFNDPIVTIVQLFVSLADIILGILETIATAIDSIFGSNLADAVSGWRSTLGECMEAFAEEHGNGTYEKVMEEVNLSSETLGLNRIEYGEAYNAGYAWGENLEDKISNFNINSLLGDVGLDLSGNGSSVLDYEELAGNVADIASDTGNIKDTVDISEEDLKYLRDAAEMETINRFTTAEISVDMGGVYNTINSEMDIDGFMDTFTDKLCESIDISAEGVHE